MIGHIDIENAHTKKVITLDLPILEHIENRIIKFDLKDLSKDTLDLLLLAISEKKELNYTDIELFYLDEDDIPYFGPDYNFYIKDETLIGYYNRELYTRSK